MSEYEYFLKHTVFGEKQVTKEEWLSAERSAGFYPKYGDGPATGGFSSGGLSGYIRPREIIELNKIKINPDKRSLRDVLQDKGVL